jgi:type I restriction enzyme S subunit
MSTEAFHEHSVARSKGSVNPYINWSDLVPFELCLPSLDEQARIAELLSKAQEVNERWTDTLSLHWAAFRAALDEVVSHDAACCGSRPIRELGEVQAGRQRSPKHEKSDTPYPYLRVANVFDGYFDLSDVKRMDFTEQERRIYETRVGDVLLNEGQSRELVGRSAVCDETVEGLCFQNTLIRFRPGPEVLSEYMQACFRQAQYSGSFAAIASQTTSMAHLGVERFARFEVPCPPLQRQRDVVELLDDVSLAGAVITEHRRRTKLILKNAINELLPGA